MCTVSLYENGQFLSSREMGVVVVITREYGEGFEVD